MAVSSIAVCSTIATAGISNNKTRAFTSILGISVEVIALQQS